MNGLDIYSNYSVSPYSALGLVSPASLPPLHGHLQGVRRVVMNLDLLEAKV